jgi:membrane protein YdbS with pleckstrin-like domain
MDLDTIRHITRDELKQFLSQKCRLNQTNAAKDTRFLSYTLLAIVILIAIMFTWWFNWVRPNYWFFKLIMTIIFIVLVFLLYKNYYSIS